MSPTPLESSPRRSDQRPEADPQPRSGRGRRASRASGDERERAIMQTAEQLLEERSLSEISVDDLARGAGISRSAFYFYFPSKAAVVLTLVDRMVSEAASARDEVSERLQMTDPIAAWRESLRIFYATFGAHRAVIRAASELSSTNAEARVAHSQILEGWVADVTERIEVERERGAAPRGAPARDLAVALVQMNERVLSAIFIDETPAVLEDNVMETLDHIWLTAVYGSAPQGQR
jgi:TetR/AcrR family transcriptional regulator, ethionamide resistance regulator